MTNTATIPITAEPVSHTPDCLDHDEDCGTPHNYAACWSYAPERGMCPYLRAPQPNNTEAAHSRREA